jgi:hypothetical protein
VFRVSGTANAADKHGAGGTNLLRKVTPHPASNPSNPNFYGHFVILPKFSDSSQSW